jgi:carotenoid cleavage dioxygenase-like enzyme
MNRPATRTPPPNRAPIDFETDVGTLPLQGTVPACLRGTLVRNGPNPLVPDDRNRVSEPVFVARSADAAEGDGWVLATVWRSATNTSDMVVFDARRVAAGPVCVASLPHRVPDGFHGNWFAAGEMPGAQA